MSRPVASFLLAQVLVAGVVIAALFLGSGPPIAARGQLTPTPTSTPIPTSTPTVTPTPTVFPTPTPTVFPTPTPTVFPTPTPGPGPIAMYDNYFAPYGTTLNIAAPGVLGNDLSNGGGAMTAQLASLPPYGSLTFNGNGGFVYVPTCVGTHTFTYYVMNSLGISNVATVSILVQAAGSVQPPCGLYVSSVLGNDVTLRWSEPAIGPKPTGFVLRGGVTPGQILASLPTNSPYPIYSITAPTGSFVVHTLSADGAITSAASNDVPLHVNVPVPPSAPVNLLGYVNGSSLALAWRNTFEGGAPTSILLDVSGGVSATLPLGLIDSFSFPIVPGGSFTLRVRATNAGGTSASSNPVALTFPGACSGVPNAPSRFLAHVIGNTVHVLWDAPTSGAAPTSYLLDVTGAFVGTFPTTTRALSGAVAPGNYNLSARAVNGCGVGVSSSVHGVTVP